MRRIAIAGMIIVLLLLAVFGIRYPLVASADGSAGPWTDGDEWYATFEYQGEIYAFSHAYTEAYWTTVVGEAFANQANAAPDGNAGDKGQAWCNDVLVTEGPDNQYDDWFLPNFDELLAGRNDYEGGDPLDVDPPALCHDYANMGLRALWTANTCYQGATGAERAYFLYPLSSWVDDSGAPGYLHCENEGTDSHWCCFDKENYGIVHTCPLVRCVRVISDEPTPIPPTPTAPPTVSPEPTDTPTPTPPPQQTELQLPALTVADDTVFSVPLTIENAVELEGWTAEFSYDPEVISRTLQVVFTSFLGGDPVGPEFEDGTVSLGQYGSGEPASGDGVLAFVEFLALRPGTTDLTFGETGLLGPGGWEPHATRDGYVVVIGGVPPSPTPTNTPTPLPPTDTPTPLPPTDTPTPLPPTETPTSTDTPTPTVVSPIDTPTATVVSPIETPTPTYPSSPVGEEPQRGVPLAAGMPLLALLLAVVTWGPARGSLAALAQRFWRGH